MTVLTTTAASNTDCPKLRIPKPDCVIEHVSHGKGKVPHNGWGGIVKLSDGRLMMLNADHEGLKAGAKVPSIAFYSSDRGKTWSKKVKLNVKLGIEGAINLKDGSIAVYGHKTTSDKAWFSRSADDGKTWSEPVKIPVIQNFHTYFGSMRELSNGRILIGGYWARNAGRPDDGRAGSPETIVHAQYGWGYWKNRIFACEGHRGPEMSFAMVYYSDDGGKTWQPMKQGAVIGWFDQHGVVNGEWGNIDVAEPNMAETRDGRVMMMLRSKVGRLLYTYSNDKGESWHSALPAELAASQTTPALIRLPKTGDLLCLWNQISNEEIRRGFQRGRLTAAISRDNGNTWENFKTIELQSGMSDAARITPEYPIERRVVARAFMGYLPDDYMHFSQPVLHAVDDMVFVRYARMWVVENEKTPSGVWPARWPNPADNEARWRGCNVLRVYPVQWFYEK